VSKSINSVTILGNVGNLPEIRSTGGGTTVASFSIATSYKAKDREEVTTWHNITAFGRTAEIVRDYVRKGSKLYVEGRLDNQQWEKDGQQHYKTVIIVNELVMLDGGAKREEPRQENNEVEIDENSIPF
jgi:single-strand DNA-binding protein